MSSRNPMNERYTTDKYSGGKSRKSAASAKPKSKAASSVVMGSKKKKPATRSEKRDQKRQARDKEYRAERQYGDPPTARFKRLKKLWIGFLICSIFMVVLSFVCNKVEGMPEWSAMVFLGGAYLCIIITLYLDLGKIRKERKAYAAKMAAAHTKESRAQEKKRKAAQREKQKKAEEEQLKKQEEAKNASIKDKFKSLNPFKK